MSYTIRQAKPEDAHAVGKVHILSWQETYANILDKTYLKNLDIQQRAESWRKIFTSPKNTTWDFVVENQEQDIVGFISGGRARESIEPYKGELYAIYILKEYQGKNLGFLLTQRLCQTFQAHDINNMYVAVLKDNVSKNFYIKNGATYIKQIEIEVGGQKIKEEYYGWKNLENFKK